MAQYEKLSESARWGVTTIQAITSEGVTFRFERVLLEEDFPLTRVYISRPEPDATEMYLGMICQVNGAQRFTLGTTTVASLSEAALAVVGAYMSGALQREAEAQKAPAFTVRETKITVFSDDTEDFGDRRFDPQY